MTFNKPGQTMVTRAVMLLVLTTTILIASCGGGSGSSSNSGSIGGGSVADQVAACEATLPQLQTAGLASNAASVIVDSGPCAYGVPFGSPAGTAPFVFILGTANAPYTSVTICMPGTGGTGSCQTIDHVLVDTGSAGLRLMASVLNSNVTLPAVSVNGVPLFECAQFADGYAWGAVRSADITIGGPNNNGELAKSMNIEVIGDPSAGTAPTVCSNTGAAENDVASFGANGVLGIGLFVNDCATNATCPVLANPLYYGCPTANNCSAVATPSANQVANPVASFVSTDFQGIMLDLPAITSATGDENVYGSLVFGLDSQANNAIPSPASANVYVADAWGDLQSSITSASPYAQSGLTCVNSFLDSGSNGIFLPSSVIPTLPTDANGWFIPNSTESMTAVITGATGVLNLANNTNYPANASPSINLSIANADTSLFPANGGNNTAFNNLGGSSSGGGSCVGPPSGSETSANSTAGIDWGLPFFYGRPVYVGNEFASVSFNGTTYATPFWAF